jgi:signal transduction histidine kinase/DNA-binding response OmpR family regulator
MLVVMLIITLGSCIVLFYSQQIQNRQLTKISLSSRQKALAEELGRKMYNIHRKAAQNADISAESDEFKVILTKWESAQKALISGSAQYGTNGDNTNKAQELLQQSSGPFVQGRDFLNQFIDTASQFELDQLDAGLTHLETYIGCINNVTGQFLSESDIQKKVTLIAVAGISGGTLLLTLFGIFGLARPLRKSFDESDTEIEEAAEKVKEALNTKAEFLSNMSHEVRTPLNGVIGMSELLLQSKLEEEQRQYARNIHTSAIHLLDLLNNVLDVAKMQSGKMQIQKERFILSDCIDQVIDLLKPLAHAKKIELMSDFSRDVPLEIIQDENRVRQILINLVNNAIKFTEKGEVVIRTELVNKENDFVQIEFSVSDTGIGIAPEKHERIFESFYQVDSANNKKYGGSGLGLAISQSIAQELGSKIKVHSAPAQGSTFSFGLVAEVSASMHKDRISALQGLRALVVDDNTTNLKILVKQLTNWGIQVTPINTPQLVTDVMTNLNKFDFVILDMQMPEMDGHSVAQKIRDRFSIKELPIIVLSSLGENMMIDGENLYNAFLTKPVKQTKLLDTIIDVLQISPLQRAKLNMQSGNKDILSNKPAIKILLAQDNDLSRAVTAKTLEALGHKYITVATGKEVIEKSKRDDYDLILMDVKENDVDGIETTKQLKRLVDQDLMPVIIGLSSNQSKDKAMCMQAGMDDIMEKPMRAEALEEKIKYWIIHE